MRMFLIVGAAAASLLVGQPASAADVARPVYKAAPVAMPTTNWSGWYAGINGGFGWSTEDIALSENGQQVFGAGVAFVPGDLRTRADGGLFGGQIGYNWHNGLWLLGIESDIQWSDIEGRTNIAVGPLPTAQEGSTAVANELEWFGTLRGRLGLTPWPTTLLYVTGGLAYGKISTSVLQTSTFVTAAAVAISQSDTESGWVLGAGFEHQLAPNWRLAAEYLYLDFGDVSLSGTGSFGGVAPYTVTATHDRQFHIARVKLHYHWPAASTAYADARSAYAQAAMPATNWSGWYMGLNGGFGWSTEDIVLRDVVPAAFGFGNSFFVPGNVRTRPDGGVFGGQIGHNWHNGVWLWGIEADIQWSDIKGSTNIAVTPTPLTFEGTTVAANELEWFGTLRGRLGLTPWPTTLLYVTGGLAYGKINTSVVQTATFVGLIATVALSQSETESGWVLGGGFEHQLAPNWRIGAEYLYLDFGDTSLSGTSAFVGSAFNYAVTATQDRQFHIARVKLHYNW